jgi:hypothetical protein
MQLPQKGVLIKIFAFMLFEQHRWRRVRYRYTAQCYEQVCEQQSCSNTRFAGHLPPYFSQFQSTRLCGERPAERSVPAFWARIGRILRCLSADEGANYFHDAGYCANLNGEALEPKASWWKSSIKGESGGRGVPLRGTMTMRCAELSKYVVLHNTCSWYV